MGTTSPLLRLLGRYELGMRVYILCRLIQLLRIDLRTTMVDRKDDRAQRVMPAIKSVLSLTHAPTRASISDFMPPIAYMFCSLLGLTSAP
jgi:hypothetical protein